jgi:hypothetical protein
VARLLVEPAVEFRLALLDEGPPALSGVEMVVADRGLCSPAREEDDPPFRTRRMAAKIIRDIEKNGLRVIACPETHVIDWLKRLSPSAIHRLLARANRRGLIPT